MALIPIKATSDLIWYVIPWLDAVRAGGAASLSAEFAVYTPPYIYLLYLISPLVPLTGATAAIKLINAPFVALAAVALGAIVAQCTGKRERGWLAGGCLCVAPTVLVNAFAWGQADIIYASFALLFVLFACRDRPLLAAVMFGIAVSFKLQAIFLAPLLLHLFLTRQMSLAQLTVIPLIYLLMMVPAAVAGRPWIELLLVYRDQAYAFDRLSLYAANPWWFADYFHLLPYKPATIIGLIAGVLFGLAITLSARRLEKGPASVLLIAMLCCAAMPYVLPKMIDRYFFLADLLSIALALVRPRYWIAAILFQLGSLTSYLAYFEFSMTGPGFAFVPMTLGVITVLLAYRQETLTEQKP